MWICCVCLLMVIILLRWIFILCWWLRMWCSGVVIFGVDRLVVVIWYSSGWNR